MRSVPKGGNIWIPLITSLLLSGSLVSSGHAHIINPSHGTQWIGHDGGSATGPTESQVVDLDPGESIKLSTLAADGQSLQVGDKLFANFSLEFKDDGWTHQNNLKPSIFSVSGLASDTGDGLSFTGPVAATGKSAKQLTICYSVTVTDPNNLISAVHLSDRGPVCGSSFSSVVEKVFTDKSCQNKVAQLEVLNPGDPNPVFNDLVLLTQPREKLYIDEDITFGGGDLRRRYWGLLLTVDDVFSQTAQIPEPSTMALSLAGLLALLCATRRPRG
ncbi:MAG TPA: PEP-CTERM sorting domain-containing protein [Verrucomicrobiae bacterium]|nr:PEP-CTERM sorting domain-containing protein [Verrucomicrobiae bacterium]